MSAKAPTADQIISLRKGGGALRDIREKFAPDLQAVKGNFSVSVELPPISTALHRVRLSPGLRGTRYGGQASCRRGWRAPESYERHDVAGGLGWMTVSDSQGDGGEG